MIDEVESKRSLLRVKQATEAFRKQATSANADNITEGTERFKQQES